MIEQLAAPQEVATPYGPVAATHRAHGFTVQPWSNPPLNSYTVLGTLAVDGTFRPMTGTEEYAQIGREKFNTMLAAAGAKKAGIFRTDDVRAAHTAQIEEEKAKLLEARKTTNLLAA